MRSEESSDECHDLDAEDPRNGFAPAAAGDWLELQAALALKPEIVAGRLRAGATPKEILDQLRAQQALLPFEASSVHARARDSRVRSSREHRIERVFALGLRVVPLTSPAYPEALADLVDAPPVLLVQGRAPAA